VHFYVLRTSAMKGIHMKSNHRGGHMKKRFLSLVLSIMIVFAMLPASALPLRAEDGPEIPQPQVEISMYSSQVRDESTKMTGPNSYLFKNNYYQLENGTVWIMCEEGFTEAHKNTFTAEVYEWNATHDPIDPVWVVREGTQDRYDMKIALPKPKQINVTYELIIKDGSTTLGRFGVNTGFTNYEANGLYIGNYVVGFSTTNDVTGIMTIHEKTTMRMGDSSLSISDDYQLFEDIDISVAEIKFDGGGTKYYEPVTNNRVKVKVSKVWIEHFYGPEAFSLSSKEPIIEVTPSTVNDWELYFKSGERSVVKLWATVSMTMNGQTVTGDIGSMVCFCIDSVEKTYDCAQLGVDTAEELNAFLIKLAEELDEDPTTIIPDGMAQTRQVTYVQLADMDYTGTVLIPDKFRELSLTPVVLRGSGNTRIIGNIIVGDPGVVNGGAHVDIEDVYFIAPEKTGNRENVAISGDNANLRRCVFYGYDAAIDWMQDGGVFVPSHSVFINNGVAIRVNGSSGTKKGTLNNNTFINNETAVQLISGFSPYYFRITNSNFINNGTDFDVYTEGTLYQYQNYFAEFCERGNGHIPMPGLPDKDKYNDCENLGLSAMLAATTEESVGNLLKRRPAQVNTHGTGARVITNPHWKFPVLGWWSGDTSLESGILGQTRSAALLRMRLTAEAEYENILIADWGADTQIINDEADDLTIDSSAFDEAGEKEICVVDADENPLGTWLFEDQTNAVSTFSLLRRTVQSDDFNAKLIVDYVDEAGELLTVTVAESSIFSAKMPLLILPYSFEGAMIIAPDGTTQTVETSNGQIAFSVSMGGTYTISRIQVFTVKLDPNNGESVIIETVLCGNTIAQPPQPTREGYVFLGWTINGTDIVEFPYTVWESVTFVAMWEKAESENNDYWYWIRMMLYNQEFDLTASATEGGAITPAGVSKVQYDRSITYTITPAGGYIIADVLVDGKSVGAVSEYTFWRVKDDHSICAIFKQINPYTDVAETDAYYDAVLYLYKNEIMNGMDTELGLFSPDTELSRAMLVTILWRMNGSPVVNYLMQFEDVPADTWYTEAVRWASSTRLVNGYSDTSFGPEDILTREQLCTILYRYVQSKGEGFMGVWMYQMSHSDMAEVSDWAFEAMAWMHMNNIYTGENNMLLPKAYAPRSLVAMMVYGMIHAE